MLLCVCVCHHGSYRKRNQQHCLKNRRAISLFLLCCAVLSAAAAVYLYHTVSFLRCESHGTTAPGLLRFYSCDSYERCSVCIILNTSWKIPTHTSSEFQKHPRSTAVVQQERTSHRLIIYIRTPVFTFFNLPHPREIKPITSRRGTSYIM